MAPSKGCYLTTLDFSTIVTENYELHEEIVQIMAKRGHLGMTNRVSKWVEQGGKNKN
jgi:hypothetical protein